MRYLFFSILFIPLSLIAAEERFDFEFKNTDIRAAIESIAKLQNQNVIFSSSVKKEKITLSLKQVTARVALNAILKSYGYAATHDDNVMRIMGSVGRGIATQSTNTFMLKHVLARDIEENIKTFLGADGSVSVNTHINALIVNAKSELFGKIVAIIRDLDQENRQVFIETKVVETTTNYVRELGIEWGTPISGHGTSITGASLVKPSANKAFFGGFITSLSDKSTLEFRLSAGETNGHLKIISNPKITTLNGKAAIIESTQTLNIRTLAPVATGDGGGADTGALLAGGLQTIKSGIRLKVTPSIMSDSLVRLDIDLSKSEPDEASAIDGIPGILDNSAITSLIVKDSQTVSIGGLKTYSKTFNTDGIPFLANLPIIGFLFGSWSDKERETELLIFLTPTVFRSSDSEG